MCLSRSKKGQRQTNKPISLWHRSSTYRRRVNMVPYTRVPVAEREQRTPKRPARTIWGSDPWEPTSLPVSASTPPRASLGVIGLNAASVLSWRPIQGPPKTTTTTSTATAFAGCGTVRRNERENHLCPQLRVVRGMYEIELCEGLPSVFPNRVDVVRLAPLVSVSASPSLLSLLLLPVIFAAKLSRLILRR